MFLRFCFAATIVALIVAPARVECASTDVMIWRTSESVRGEIVSLEQLRRLAISLEPPKYPSAARRQGIMGKGDFELLVDRKTGKTIGVRVVKTTGSSRLDLAAIQALKTWQFKPAAVFRVQLPVSFVMNLSYQARLSLPREF